MNDYFINITKNLNLKPKTASFNQIDEIIDFYKNHMSIRLIKAKLNESRNTFSFCHVTEDDVRKELLNLSTKKATRTGDIPVSILKVSIDTYLPQLTRIINVSFDSGTFPDELKLAEVLPIFKKCDSLNKENYRPVSILSHVSKVFERLIYKQIDAFTQDKFSKFLTGFRKNHNTQDCLLHMLESWKAALDKGKIIGAIMMDLSKAFDTLDHDLLIAKLSAYGFNYDALLYIRSYLTERKQRVNINHNFSSWEKLFAGVPQGSILGPLLFNIFINDLFYFIHNATICNYADDNTLYKMGENIHSVKSTLVSEFKIVTEWFYENCMVLNPQKCHYMILGLKEDDYINIEGIDIKNSDEETLLGIKIDKRLNFNSHTKDICRRAAQKLNALCRISYFMTNNQRTLLINTLVKSQFNYCPLVWMFSSRKSNNRINRIHERSLRIITGNQGSSYDELLSMTNESTIHQNNLQQLAVQIFKFLHHLSPQIMENLFNVRENRHNIRNFIPFHVSNKKTIMYGIDTVSHISSKIWELIPDKIKAAPNLQTFKEKIKTWYCQKCPCTLCKTYIPQLGYINN